MTLEEKKRRFFNALPSLSFDEAVEYFRELDLHPSELSPRDKQTINKFVDSDFWEEI